MKRLLQLFNVSSVASPNGVAADNAPSHLKYESSLADFGVSVETLPPSGFPFNPLAGRHNAYQGLDPLRALRVLMTRRRVACVCAHMESAVFILLLRRVFLFRPKVVIWEVPWSPGWRFREMVARFALPRADLSIVFSRSQVELVKEQYGREVPVQSLDFCIDTVFFDPAYVSPPEGSLPDRYVLCVGQDPGRDFQVVVDALAGEDTAVVLRTANAFSVGPGPAENIIHLKERVDWQEYRALYAKAAAVVVAVHETPNASGVTALLEAMSMAKPVVVTGTAALADYLPPCGAGVVVPVGDAEAIRTAIRSLMNDEEGRRRMGEKARAFALERFSPQRYYAAIARMVDGVTSDRPVS